MNLPSSASFADRMTTLGYRLMHQGLKLVWRVFQPTTMGVKIIARDPCGRILLVKARYLEQWTLPGGGVHKQETPEDAAARELREESGIRVFPNDLRLVGLLSSFKEGKSDYVAMFVCDIGAGIAPTPGAEIAESKLFPIDALPEATSERTRRRIRELTGDVAMRGIW